MSLEALLRITFDHRVDQAPPDSAVDGARVRRQAFRQRRRQRLAGLGAVVAVLAATGAVVPWVQRGPVTVGAPGQHSVPAPGPTLDAPGCSGIRVFLSLDDAPQTRWPVSATGTTISIPGSSLLRISVTGPCFDQVSYRSTNIVMLDDTDRQNAGALGPGGSGALVAHFPPGGTTSIVFDVSGFGCVGSDGTPTPPVGGSACAGGELTTQLAVVDVHLTPVTGPGTTTP